jgi:hypothetical protein
MSKMIPEQKAKQGRAGRPVLMVLICALILAMLAWAGVEIWGEQIDTHAAQEPGQATQ